MGVPHPVLYQTLGNKNVSAGNTKQRNISVSALLDQRPKTGLTKQLREQAQAFA